MAADQWDQYAEKGSGAKAPDAADPWAQYAETGASASTTKKAATPAKPSVPDYLQGKVGPAIAGAVGGEFLKGAGKSLFEHTASLTKPISRRVLGMSPQQYDAAVADFSTPSNRPQALGGTAESVAEFAVPEAAAGKVASAVKAGKYVRAGVKAVTAGAGAAGLTKLQGGEDATAAGVLSGLSPIFEVSAGPLTQYFKSNAAASLAKVLGKSDLDPANAKKAVDAIVPVAFDTGIPSTWKRWFARTEGLKQTTGKAVEMVKAGAEGDKWVPVQPVIDALDDLTAKASKVTVAAKGGPVTGPVYNPRLQTQIDKVKTILERVKTQFGGDVPARVLHDIKSSWNDVVFAKQSSAAIDMSQMMLNAEKRAKSTAVGAIRDVLASHAPELSKVDKAYHLAADLHAAVTDAALQATGKIEGKVASTVATQIRNRVLAASAIGSSVGGYQGYKQGGATGAVAGTVLGGTTGLILNRAFQSPFWKAMPAKFYDKLATYIANGDANAVRRMVTPIIAATAGSHKTTKATVDKVKQRLADASKPVDMSKPQEAGIGGLPEGLNAFAIEEMLRREGIPVATEVAEAVAPEALEAGAAGLSKAGSLISRFGQQAFKDMQFKRAIAKQFAQP